MKRKTLLLINPINPVRQGFLVNRATKSQPISLGIIASLTPPDWKVKLIDENFRQFRFYEADLVGITAFTSNVGRAYEIADLYRQKGIPTVLGGIHASMVPEEAAGHVDSVVVGEAEGVWAHLLQDFEAGRLQKIYRGNPQRLISQPSPRRELFHPGYICASIQTSRGCPMNCTFCSVTAFNGSRYRFRPIDDVIAELKEIPQKYVFFIDDNIIGYSPESKDRAKMLFEAIIRKGIKKHWISQSSINFADDKELMKLAARSGCRMIFMGIESESEVQLKEANKKLNLSRGPESYTKIFKALHREGIGVIAGLIFGWDNDNADTIRARARFARKSGADSFQCSILTPLPGTQLFDSLREKDRLLYTKFPEDWKRYDFMEPVIRHPSMTPEELMGPISDAYERIFARPFILYKGLKTAVTTRHPITTLMLFLNYFHYRNMYSKGSNFTLIRK